MNRENLGRMPAHIRTIPQAMFDMDRWRTGDAFVPECESVGCVIGHCTILDPKPLPMWSNGIDFEVWSEQFTGMEAFSDDWNWCFAYNWAQVDNTPEGAARRIEWLLDKGLPEDWFEQMEGDSPLCYA